MPGLNYTYDKKRFEAFFDAILAIILTILVLELKVPRSESAGDGSTKQQVLALIPSFISYFGSFLLIVGIWIDHHLLFLNIQKINRPFILFNMLFVFTISLIPFTTAFAGDNYQDPFAVALLFANYVVMNVLFAGIFLFAQFRNLVPENFFVESRHNAIYAFVGLIVLAAAIPIAYFNTTISFILGILVFGGHLAKKR